MSGRAYQPKIQCKHIEGHMTIYNLCTTFYFFFPILFCLLFRTKLSLLHPMVVVFIVAVVVRAVVVVIVAVVAV